MRTYLKKAVAGNKDGLGTGQPVLSGAQADEPGPVRGSAEKAFALIVENLEIINAPVF